MTDPDIEFKVQQQWKLKPDFSELSIFNEYISHEFFTSQEREKFINVRVEAIVNYAAASSPYYQAAFNEMGINPKQIQTYEDLEKIAVLDKETLIEKVQQLQVTDLPPSEIIAKFIYSSGTTGRRAKVLTTRRSNMMFGVLMARNYRWFKLDPMSTFAAFREPRFFTEQLDPNPPMKNSRCYDQWNVISTWFQTGKSVYLTSTTPVDEQQAWLRKYQPSVLQAYPSVLEEHAFRSSGKPVVGSLTSLLAISAQLTDPMRKRVEESFKVPLNQNYGLNEIGMVAVRCCAGRYHVHMEHCIVEIADLQGKQCKPGESGRILVTSLMNFAMPLLRYDTGDMATVPKGECPCGRTLPSFEKISGRYRRWLNVPPGTKQKFTRISSVFESLPAELVTKVQGYQVHLNTDDTLIFKIQASEKLPKEIHQILNDKWREFYPEETGIFSVLQVDEIETPINCKTPDFTTDYDETPKHENAF